MTTTGDVLDWLEAAFPAAWAQDWDNVGLQVGDPGAVVTRVIFALDPTLEVIEDAVRAGAEVVITHHPLVFEPLTAIDRSTPTGSVIAAAISGGCSVIAAHTNADAASEGVADALADALGMADQRAALEPIDGADVGVGLGRSGALLEATDVAGLAERIADVLGVQAVIIGDPGRAVRTLAVCGGSGASALASARAAGADAYVTGDVKHHAALDARAMDLVVLDAGHHATEWPWVPRTAARFQEAFPSLAVSVSSVATDPFSKVVP